MKEYICLVIVHHDGKEYAAGDSIKLDEAAAAALLSVGAVEATMPTKAAKAPKA